MEKVKLTPEQEEKAKRVSEEIAKILQDNGMGIGTEMVYEPTGISAKPIIIFTEPTVEKND